MICSCQARNELCEEHLLKNVLTHAKLLGWRTAHFRPARTANGWRTAVQGDGKGFPDLVLVRDGRLIVAELKRDGKMMSTAQEDWMREFAKCGTEWAVWRPKDWRSGAIEKALA